MIAPAAPDSGYPLGWESPLGVLPGVEQQPRLLGC